jgi:hypothetical protein
MSRHAARMRKTANLYRILERKLLQTCPHRRRRRKLENKIKIDLDEIDYEYQNLMELAQ